jgi:hypothetical protein
MGKEGKYKIWGIYLIFPNKFGSPINSKEVQKQFWFQDFEFKFCFEFELDSKGKLFLIF